MRAVDIRYECVMPTWGWIADPVRPIYNYTIHVYHKTVHTTSPTGRQLFLPPRTLKTMDFTGHAEEAAEVAKRLRQLVLIEHGVSDEEP